MPAALLDPPAALAPWVGELALVTARERRPVVQVPEVTSTFVIRTGPRGRTDLLVAGPRTRGSYHAAGRPPSCLRLSLRPGRVRALLGVPVSGLADRVVPIEELWDGFGGLGDDPESALTTVAGALRERDRSAPGGPADARLVAAAVRALAPATGPAPRPGVVAERLGIGERHLRTVFAREVGLSPKHYARIVRVRRVLALAGTRQWARLAGDTGFFDQAHLIADFKALMGVSPGAYLAGRLPTPTRCTRAEP